MLELDNGVVDAVHSFRGAVSRKDRRGGRGIEEQRRGEEGRAER